MNVDLIKRKFWNAVRPLHSPLTKAARRRLGRNYSDHPEMELPPAYEAVQLEVERRLHSYLHVPADEIEQIVIVGANEGQEIARLRQTYPRSRFLCFEPSPKWYKRLTKNFCDADFVKTRELALSDSVGTATFHELPLAGNGSLLPPNPDRWSAFNKIKNNEITSFEVQVGTLDKEAAGLDKIDLLWIDVQGAEGNVLKGGRNTLGRTAAVFLEVALVDSPYEGTLFFPELNALLSGFGFFCVGLGIDGWNFSGNAFWVRDIGGRLASIQNPNGT
jgi:FkbM family methyltransferase